MCCRNKTSKIKTLDRPTLPSELQEMDGITQLYYVGAKTSGQIVRYSGNPSGAVYLVPTNNIINVYDQDLTALLERRDANGDPFFLDAKLYAFWRSGGMALVRQNL